MAIELEDETPGIPEWVVTFGDMMSLLLTFFIMLVSMSEIKAEEKYQAMVESLRKRFGHASSIWSSAPGPSKPRNARFEKRATLGRAKRVDTMRGGARLRAPIGNQHRIRTVRRGDQSTPHATMFFERGEAQLNDELRDKLRRVVETIGGKPQKIEIRGYASKNSVQGDEGRATSHTRLAYRRCRQTMMYLVQSGIRRERIRLGVIDPGDATPTGNKNLTPRQFDRVEIVVVNELTSDFIGTKEEQSQRYSDDSSEARQP